LFQVGLSQDFAELYRNLEASAGGIVVLRNDWNHSSWDKAS